MSVQGISDHVDVFGSGLRSGLSFLVAQYAVEPPACLGIDPGFKNFSLCWLAENKVVKRWEDVNLLKLCGMPPDRSCDDLTSTEVHAIVAYAMPRLFPYGGDGISHVGIEQQPHGKYANVRMILLSHLVYQFFRQHLVQARRGSTLLSVEFLTARRKYSKEWLVACGLSLERPTYALRKKTSCELCTRLRQIRNIEAPSIEKFKKRDDLSDSFLLALAVSDDWLSSSSSSAPPRARKVKPVKKAKKPVALSETAQANKKVKKAKKPVALSETTQENKKAKKPVALREADVKEEEDAAPKKKKPRVKKAKEIKEIKETETLFSFLQPFMPAASSITIIEGKDDIKTKTKSTKRPREKGKEKEKNEEKQQKKIKEAS